MFTLGIPNRQYRRATQVLGPELANPISYNTIKQDDGFYMFSFPEVDEYDFKDIVNLLKANGVTTIGADTELTERKIMKLTDLLKEQPSPDENNLLDILKQALERMEDPKYRGGIDGCPKADHFREDIANIIEDYEEESSADAIAMGADDVRDMQFEQENNLSRKYPAEVDGKKTEVTFKNEKDNDDDEINVQVSWENESYDLTFTLDSEGDDHGTEGSNAMFVAKSEDGKWEFEMEVYLNDGHESGQCNPCIADYPMQIKKDIYLNIMKAEDSRMDPAIRSDFDDPVINENHFKKQMQIRAGIIK